jgi:hypothetical protein
LRRRGIRLEYDPAAQVTAYGDEAVMNVRIFGMVFGTGEIVIAAFVIIIVTMYFMQKSR